MIIQSKKIQIEFQGNENLFVYKILAKEKSFEIKMPCFEIDGENIAIVLDNLNKAEEVKLRNGVMEYIITGDVISKPGLKLATKLRVAEDNAVIRFSYKLSSSKNYSMTKKDSKDNLMYLAYKGDSSSLYKEVRFSEFNERYHSFTLSEVEIKEKDFANKKSVMGPMFIEIGKSVSALIAYEHGSQVPDKFVEFSLNEDYQIKLKAVKGNYYNGEVLDEGGSYESIWLQFCAVEGGEAELSKEYRTFIFKYITQNNESRKPYIFYNTWAFQERNKWWNNKTFLSSVNDERILNEIEVAHKMGIDVFVIDTGWYEKTGDWVVDVKRFKDRLKNVKNKLDEYSMKLGLWFDPQAAAVTSSMLKRNKNNIITENGKTQEPIKIWETEESYRMCLASAYHEDFAKELIRLSKEVGVTYFKWDAIAQYGCNSSKHFHGNKDNTEEERGNCYAFEVGRYMSKVVDMLCTECPDAIVDFDITEGHRYVGLGFLSSGKYFLINNGPYYPNYDIPVSENEWINMFVFPGPARPWICRTPLTFDKWIPSILFLTHYIPDEPNSSQIINIASLILGQNGIWGDLLSVSKEGVETFGKLLSLYKEVREDITISSAIRQGDVGGSPEVYEKINPQNGKGAVVIFSSNNGEYTYITENWVDSKYFHTEGVTISKDEKGRAIIRAIFEEVGAKIILFGVGEQVSPTRSDVSGI